MRRLVNRIGHRGSFLAFLALLDILVGYSILADPAQLRAYALILPAETWGVIWLAVGAFLLTGIAVRRDKFHFGISAAFKFAWAAVYVNVTLVDHVPRAWVSVVIWAAFAAIVVVVSSWPEQRRYPPREERRK